MMIRQVALVCCLTWMVVPVWGQVTVELPRFAETTITSSVHVPDAGAVPHRRTTSQSSCAMLAANRLEDQLCSKTSRNGITCYDIIHNGQPLQMDIHNDGSIEMTVTQEFDDDSADELFAQFPGLVMDYRSFPRTARSDSRVRLKLEIETTFTFYTPAELEQQRPDLFRIYLRYTRPPRVDWVDPSEVVAPPKQRCIE